MKHSEVLSRYVNTGGQIPEEQYERLTPSLKKSYIRRRGVDGNYFEWEFEMISDDERIKFIENKGEELNSNEISYLIFYSENSDLIATKIIDVKGEKLDGFSVDQLIKHSDNKDIIAIKIIESKGEKLDDSSVYQLITVLNGYKYDTTPFILKIIDVKGEKLDYKDILQLLYYSNDKDKTATKIIEKKGVKLTNDEIYFLIHYSNDKELIKKTLLQNGVDYKLINDVITNDNIDIPLIPDNYQSMLQEIRRIKEIMK